jgi:hypothetical protein
VDEVERKSRKVSASTQWAVDNPRTFALIACAGVAVFGIVVVGDFRAVVPVTIATPVLCWFIWRPKSPIARRVRERMKVEEGEDS